MWDLSKSMEIGQFHLFNVFLLFKPHASSQIMLCTHIHDQCDHYIPNFIASGLSLGFVFVLQCHFNLVTQLLVSRHALMHMQIKDLLTEHVLFPLVSFPEDAFVEMRSLNLTFQQ